MVQEGLQEQGTISLTFMMRRKMGIFATRRESMQGTISLTFTTRRKMGIFATRRESITQSL